MRADSTWYQWNYGLTNMDVRGLTVNQEGTIFAATMGGGIFKLEPGTGNWDWQPANNGIDFLFMNTIICNSEGDLFAGTIEGGGIYRSVDDGYSWSLVNNGLTTTHINALTIDNHGHIFAGGYPGVFLSTDNGESWQQKNNGIPDPYVLSLAVYIDNIVFAGLDFNGGIYQTTNDGETWLADTTGIGTPQGVNALLMKGNYLFAGTYGKGIFRRTSATSWQPVNEGVESEYIISLALDHDNNLMAGAFQGGGVYRSNENGNRWYREIEGLAASTVMALCTDYERLYAATYGSGIHTTYAYDQNWSRQTGDTIAGYLNDMYYHEMSNRVYATADNVDGKGGLYRTSDHGNTWSELLQGYTEFDVRGVVVNAQGDVFVATYGDGVLRSTDDGVTWQQLNEGLDCPYLVCIEVTPEGVLFVGSTGCETGVYRSIDNGANWVLVNNGLFTKDVKTLFYYYGRLMAGTHPVFGNGGGIYLSENLGDSWSEINGGLESLTVNDIMSTPYGRIFAATSNGILEYFGTNYWIPMNSNLDNKKINGLMYDYFMSLYAGTSGAGAWAAVIEGNAKNIAKDIIKLYPNPSTRSITFDNPFSSGMTVYSIFNQQGGCVKTGVCKSSSNTLAIMHLSPGSYFLRLTNGSSIQKAIFIKQ